ncbi:hypothetical protein [Bacillus infantis]|uniref:hypothetical protein n=1 Tax=Bacillus infantis TaxID=324767 RepID=UPI0013EC208C|nr:hypothetical protein [Bacillus infantis]
MENQEQQIDLLNEQVSIDINQIVDLYMTENSNLSYQLKLLTLENQALRAKLKEIQTLEIK